MTNIPYPRLLDSNLNYVRDLYPVNVSISLNITPLSTVSMEVTNDDLVPIRSWVEFFSPMGSVGIYRLRSPTYSYGRGTTSTLEFEHAITEVADYLIKTKLEEEGVYPGTAIHDIFAHYHGTKWQLGTFPSQLPNNPTVTVSETYSTVLNAILNVLEQVPMLYLTFDFSTTPWTINFGQRDTTVSCEGRLTRNVQSAEVTYDDSDLVTRLFMQGLPKAGSNDDDDLYGFLESQTAQTYGWIEKQISGSDSYTSSEALKVATLYLEKHEKPMVSVTIDAEDLSQITGEPFDTFTIGKKMRLVLDDMTVEENITALDWDDVYFSPETLTVTLAEVEETVVKYLTSSDSSDTTSSSSSGSSSSKGSAKKSKYTVKIEGMSELIVYAISEQAAINAVVSLSYTGNVYVNGIKYYVVNRTIQKDPNEEEEEE